MKQTFLILIAIIGTITSYACKCNILTFSAEVVQADQIFIGTVLKKTTADKVYYLFTVSKTFKGDSHDTLTIKTGFGGPDCGMVFEVGKTYLVYSHNGHTNSCRRNALANNNADLSKLKHLFDLSNRYRSEQIRVVTVSGTAFDTTKGRNGVQVVLNDTLRKFREGKTPNWDAYAQLIKDPNYVVWAGENGKFTMKGKLTDSIHFGSLRNIPKAYSIADLLKMKTITINLEPEVCIPYVFCNDSLPAKLYAVVAEKIRVTSVPEKYYCNVIPFNSEFTAEYRVVENVYGHFPKDTIRFTAFTHAPLTFSNFKYVLLFVGEYCGKLYHEKYQYFDVYKTVNGKWASPGDPYRFDKMVTKNIKPQPMEFVDTLWFDARTYGRGEIKQKFPDQYFRVEGNRATPLMGTYVEDLFTIKKEGTLKGKFLNK